MRVKLAGVLLLLLVTLAPPVAAARAPITLLLAEKHGDGSVAVSAGTAHLHGRIWLFRHGGSGTAHGKASVACQGKMTAAGKGVTWQWFAFTIGPDSRREVWRHAGNEPCTVSVSLTGKGLLSVSLRGY
jgi:hypothetical protein